MDKQRIAEWLEGFINKQTEMFTNVDILEAFAAEFVPQWVSVEERLPTEKDADEYDEVLTVQVGRRRPTMMKYWELRHCPFTKFWFSVPKLPTITTTH